MQPQQRKIRVPYVYQILASFDERALQDSRRYSLAVREKLQYAAIVELGVSDMINIEEQILIAILVFGGYSLSIDSVEAWFSFPKFKLSSNVR